MKASKLIEKLQEAIEKYGDHEVERLGSYKYEPVNCILYNEKEENGFCPRHENTFII